MLQHLLPGSRCIETGADDRDSRQNVIAAEAMVAAAVFDVVVGADGWLRQPRALRASLKRVGDAYKL